MRVLFLSSQNDAALGHSFEWGGTDRGDRTRNDPPCRTESLPTSTQRRGREEPPPNPTCGPSPRKQEPPNTPTVEERFSSQRTPHQCRMHHHFEFSMSMACSIFPGLHKVGDLESNNRTSNNYKQDRTSIQSNSIRSGYFCCAQLCRAWVLSST